MIGSSQKYITFSPSPFRDSLSFPSSIVRGDINSKSLGAKNQKNISDGVPVGLLIEALKYDFSKPKIQNNFPLNQSHSKTHFVYDSILVFRPIERQPIRYSDGPREFVEDRIFRSM